MKFRKTKSFLTRIIKRAYKKHRFKGANYVILIPRNHRHQRWKSECILSLEYHHLPS